MSAAANLPMAATPAVTRRETLVTLIEFAMRGGGTEELLQ